MYLRNDGQPISVEFPWGSITQKPGKLYLGFFDWPKQDFFLEGLKNKVTKAYLLSDPQKKPLSLKDEYNKETDHRRLKIQLPATAPDLAISVVVLEIEGKPQVEETICQQASGNILLPGVLAKAEKDGVPGAVKFTSRGGGADWRKPDTNLSWSFKVEKPGKYKLDIVTTETENMVRPNGLAGRSLKL